MSILSCLLFCGALALLFYKQVLAPVAAYSGLLVCWLGHLLPISTPMLVSWVCMTLVVMGATYMQPIPIQQQTRGIGYMTVGAFTGMMVGLAVFSFGSNPSVVNGAMILGTVVGLFCGYLMFTRTARGREVAPGSGNFFRYLLAKGFPVAITVMQIGVALVLLISLQVYKDSL